MKRKRKIIFITSFVIVTLILVSYFSLRDHKNSLEKATGFDVAIYVNNNASNDVPTAKGYTVNVSCKNATARWDYTNWKLVISNVTGKVSCNVDFDSKTLTKFNDYVTDLVSSTSSQTDWKVTNLNGIRYQGLNPNNYVMFNNETWRVIGVFDSTIHGEDASLVKIVRNDSVGGFGGDYDDNSMYSLLNTYYYTGTDGSGDDSCKIFNHTYNSTTSSYSDVIISQKCDFSINGILDETSRNMIESVSWMDPTRTQSITLADAYTEDAYDASGTYKTSYVGMASISDYGYASLGSDCTDSIILNTNPACAYSNWLYHGEQEMFSGQEYQSISAYGKLSKLLRSSTSSTYVATLRPAVYLSEDVYIIDGDGSSANPFILGMN